MRQRIRVIGIVKREEKLLFLRRNAGRSLEPARFELPTGKILFGEQPEEAMGRSMWEFVGVKPQEVKLMDVVTFTYLEGASQLGNLYIIYSVQIGDGSPDVSSDRYTGYKWVHPGELETISIDEASKTAYRIVASNRGGLPASRAVAHSAVVFVDGASRGNPGPAGIGYYIVGADGVLLKKGGEFIGFNTSRMAEYLALKEGLEQALELGLKTIRIISDSLMVVNQVKSIYQVKNGDLMKVNEDVMNMLAKFEAWEIEHVLREHNANADAQANIAIDDWQRNGKIKKSS